MIIESMELLNYRNYESLKIAFDPGTNIFYGDNAQGKTNVLEALLHDQVPPGCQRPGDHPV